MEIRWITANGVKQIPADGLAEIAARDDGVIWVHLDHSDERAMALLVEMVKPRRDDLLDVNNRTPVPKLHIYPDHHYSAINGLARGSDGLLHFQPLKTFLTPHMLWTVFGPANATMSKDAVNHDLDIVRRQVDDGEIRPTTAFELIAAMRAVMLRGQEDLIGSSARRVADLEGRVMTKDPVAAEMVLQDLFELRHDLQTIRINAAQAYEVLRQPARPAQRRRDA